MNGVYKLSGLYDSLNKDIENINIDEVISNPVTDESYIEDIAACVKNFELLSGAVKNAENEMKERRNKIEYKISKLKEFIIFNMKMVDITNISSNPQFEIKIRKNPPSLVIDIQNDIPQEFKEVIVTEKINNEKIKDLLKKGEYFEWAHLEQGTSLTIK